MDQSRQNMKGAGRKKSKINDDVYPLLKKSMERAAKIGGSTTKKAQCAKFREIALKLGYKDEDIPQDVRNGRMQRFDEILDFTLRACNQKKSNRNDNYDIDRLSRYLKDVLKKNIEFALTSVKC